MFHLIAKLFWLICAPANLIVWLVLGAALLFVLRRQRMAGRVLLSAALLALLFAVLPIGNMLLRPLENEYPRRPLPARIDGIVVLGGGLKSSILQSRGTLGEDESIERLLAAFDLARRIPSAQVIFSGGRGGLTTELPEAVMAGYVWRDMGLDPRRIVLESRARDTWENLLFARALAHPKRGGIWVLATSAYHLPRAMGIARRLGWRMLPWPTNYVTRAHGEQWWPNPVRNLHATDLALHEWIGLLVYRLTGRWAAQLRPAPAHRTQPHSGVRAIGP